MEFFCSYCKEWFDISHCEGHYNITHGQPGMTLENLRKRMSVMGGLETREELLIEEDDERRVFVTNNFRHHM